MNIDTYQITLDGNLIMVFNVEVDKTNVSTSTIIQDILWSDIDG